MISVWTEPLLLTYSLVQLEGFTSLQKMNLIDFQISEMQKILLLICDSRIGRKKTRYYKMLTKEEKALAIEKNKRAEKDTGSAEVQIALLTEKIKKLTIHMTNNKHDYSSKRGMDIMIARRANLLSYLKRTDYARYEAALANLKASTKKN